MPTTLERTTITHTPPIQDALKVAERRWPEASKAELLKNLVSAGSEKVAEEDDATYGEWLKNVERLAHKYRGYWPDDYIEKERAEWREY